MIQVVNRALDILECVGRNPETPKTLGEIAGELELNAATCANIIKTLVNRKYLDKIDRSKGYLLGPKAYALSSSMGYRKSLVDAAQGELEALTKKINENSLLAVLNEDMRISIARASSAQAIQANTADEKKAYDAASGRLLVAMLPEPELERYIARYGLPQADWWRGVQSKKTLLAELKKIRTDGYALQITEREIVGIAVPINSEDKVVASISVYLPMHRFNKEKKNELLALLRRAAAKIEKNFAQE